MHIYIYIYIYMHRNKNLRRIGPFPELSCCDDIHGYMATNMRACIRIHTETRPYIFIHFAYTHIHVRIEIARNGMKRMHKHTCVYVYLVATQKNGYPHRI